MKKSTFAKVMTIATVSFLATACASGPEKVIELPKPAAALPKAVQAPQIVETPRGPSLTLDSVLFDFEQSSLRPEAGPTIEKAAAYLNANPERSALIEGHTDHTGDEAYNQNLSVQRSESIRNALTSMGIDDSRIETTGYGERQPHSDNSTLEGRRANRRVEMIFTAE